MEEMPIWREHQIVQVPVSNTQHIRQNRISSYLSARYQSSQAFDSPQLLTKVSMTPASMPKLPSAPSSA